MQNNQPKFLTKNELRSAAMRELKVSKSAFDFAWMAAIEDTGATIGTSHYADGCAPRASLTASKKLPRKSATAAVTPPRVWVASRLSPIRVKATTVASI